MDQREGKMNTIELKSLSTTMPVIGFNYDEIKSELVRLTEKYKGLVVTAETLKSSKSTQRELSSLRKQINDYMVKISREVKQHVEPFRDQCKELIAVVLEVENPIKESLVVFEERRKKNQQLWVNDIVHEMIEKYRLGDNYSSRIVTEERFLNATITEDEVVNNIESQAKLLEAEKDGEIQKIETLRTFLATTNKNLNLITPLVPHDFDYWVKDRQIIDLQEVMKQITLSGGRRQVSEQKAQEVKVAEPIVDPVVTGRVIDKVVQTNDLRIDTPVSEFNMFQITQETDDIYTMSPSEDDYDSEFNFTITREELQKLKTKIDYLLSLKMRTK
jgi:hypothetical protein